MVLRQTLERPQRAALELHKTFALAGAPKLCPRADALLWQPGTESGGVRSWRRTNQPWLRLSDIPPPGLVECSGLRFGQSWDEYQLGSCEILENPLNLSKP